jgi:hypothetical protein
MNIEERSVSVEHTRLYSLDGFIFRHKAFLSLAAKQHYG